jgi:hypothetical protein
VAWETHMELDDLRPHWQAIDLKLDRALALNLQVFTETRTRRARLRLLPLLLLQPFQLVVGVAVTGYCAQFWMANMGTASLLVSGLALHTLGIGLIADAVMRILLITRINVSEPIVTIQRRLAHLRHWEIRSFKWVWVAVWALLPAMLIVVARSLTGVDLWARWPSGISWLAVGSAVGLALSYGLDVVVSRRWPDLYVGHSIAWAQAALDEIEEFARE